MRLSHATYIDHVRADGERLAAATISVEPLSLYLWMWGRGPRDSLTVDGVAAAVDHLRARLVTATQ
jgi:MDMPI C-terminal domain